MPNEVFASVWDALYEKEEEASHMKIKSKLLLALTKKIQSWNVTQKEAAGRLGITQPRVNEILTGRISSITLDRLLALLDRANLEVSIDIHDKVAAAA